MWDRFRKAALFPLSTVHHYLLLHSTARLCLWDTSDKRHQISNFESHHPPGRVVVHL